MLLYYLGQENSLAKVDQAGVVGVGSIGLSDRAVLQIGNNAMVIVIWKDL